MAYYRLIDGDEKVYQVRRMNFEVANALNKERDDDLWWERGLGNESKTSKIKSGNVILRGLDMEGFNEHSMNTVNRWFRTNAHHAIRLEEEFDWAKDAFADIMRDQPPETRRIVGKFMSMQVARCFQAGVKIGLAGRVVDDELDEIYGSDTVSGD